MAEAVAQLLSRLAVAERMGWHAVTVETDRLRAVLDAVSDQLRDEQRRME
jgi:hypothetical protein